MRFFLNVWPEGTESKKCFWIVGLFNMLWDKTDRLSKIHLVDGDVSIEGLGMKPEDAKNIAQNVNYVIHSAANVSLDDPIQKTLMNNYVSTRNVLKICEGIVKLRAYVHISTAFVNINFPKGTTVKEKIYPLLNGDKVIQVL